MAHPYFNKKDRAKIRKGLDAILDGELSMGTNVKAFEQEFAISVGVRHAIAMNSCTSTLEAALLAHNVAGREVILPAETFVATGMAIHLCGARPIFSEISTQTLCLDIADVKRKVNRKTAGIIWVHMAGFISPEIFSMRRFCEQRGLFLIEDAAHAVGAKLNGVKAGAWGHAGCFSFYPSKVITAGEGGMLTTNEEKIAQFARSYQNRGRDMENKSERYSLPGRNVRMTEIAALIGRTQLSRLEEFLRHRRMIAATYRQYLQRDDQIQLLIPEDLKSSALWKIPVLLTKGQDRNKITNTMLKAKIAVDWAYHPALHLQPVFRNLYGTKEGLLPITENLLSRHLCLPCHPKMTKADAVRVAKVLTMALKN